MISVKGFAAKSGQAKLEPFEFKRRDPGPNDVLIDIHYAGICHSDIHTARNEWGGDTVYPLVPGHEIAGKVEKVGSAVTKFKVGDHVGVGCFVDSCRQCTNCKDGEEQYCDGHPNSKRHLAFTYNSTEMDGSPTYGGYSQKIVVDENYVLKIPESLPLDKAAPLLCAGITTYSPLRKWKVGPGQKVAVMGLGGLGHMAVKIAAKMEAEVTVLSTSPKKKDDALRMGAKNYVATRDPSTLQKYAGYFDLIINTISAPMDLNPYFGLLKRDGTMVLVGVPEKPAEIAAFSLIGRRRRLAGSLIGGIKETQEMLDFCADHKIACDIEVISPSQINEAYDRVVKGDVHYRFVIDTKKF